MKRAAIRGWMVAASLVALGATSLAWAADSPVGDRQPASLPVAGDPVPASVKGDVIILHATNDHTGIDAKIPKGADFSKAPFSSYDSYKLIERVDLKLPKDEAKTVALPDGGKMVVTYKDFMPGKEKAPGRFAIRTSLEKPDGKVFLPNLDVNAQANEWFFLAGQKHKGGILVIGIKIAP